MIDDTFELRPDDEYIELVKLLKLKGISQTGGHAKLMIEDGLVTVNGVKEFRKRKKIRDGEHVETEGVRILVVKRNLTADNEQS